jgi:hypothetical protein
MSMDLLGSLIISLSNSEKYTLQVTVFIEPCIFCMDNFMFTEMLFERSIVDRLTYYMEYDYTAQKNVAL